MHDYQLLLCVDTEAPASGAGEVLKLSSSADPAAVLATIQASGVTPADLRSRTLVLLPATGAYEAICTYAALCGFAGRRLDVLTDGSAEVVHAATLSATASHLEDAGKPSDPPEWLQVGAPHPDVDSVLTGAELDPATVTSIRYAKKLRFAPGDVPVELAIHQFLAVAGIRVRNNADRFPLLVDPAAPLQTSDDTPSGVDLDQLRRAASELRRSIRLDDRNAVADSQTLSDRQQRLALAAAAPLDAVLVRLGSYLSEETGMWRCPRPTRHKNGDANPSTKVGPEGLMCYRCDLEPIDTLRVVVDTLALSPDDAANWILDSSESAAS